MIIILFSMGLDKSALSNNLFGKLVFRLPVLSVFFACSVFLLHLHKRYKIYIIVFIGVSYSVILF